MLGWLTKSVGNLFRLGVETNASRVRRISDHLRIQLVVTDWVNERKGRFDDDGFETLDLLVRIHKQLCHSELPHSSVRLRESIRRIEILNRRIVLNFVIERTPRPDIRLLAIWLRGRCGGTRGTSMIAKYRKHASHQVRKEVVRALRRLSGWQYLREISRTEQVERIKRMALPLDRVPHSVRLSNLTRHLSRTNPQRTLPSLRREERTTELFVSPQVDFKRSTPPKTVAIIRMLLKRISNALATR